MCEQSTFVGRLQVVGSYCNLKKKKKGIAAIVFLSEEKVDYAGQIRELHV